MTSHNISRVHFVGSVCLPTAHDVFKTLAEAFPPSALKTIPDGEPDKRQIFILFQREVFQKASFVLVNEDFSPNYSVLPDPHTPTTVDLGPIQYDNFALSSYKQFSTLQEQGLIAPDVRFQVSLPTPVNVIGNLINPAWRTTVEPIYVAAMKAAIRRIQDSIPAEKLAIQLDMAGEFAYLENVVREPAWFSPTKQGLVDRVLEMIAEVDKDVQLGLHLCYGDLGHKHFTEPNDLSFIVDFANSLVASSSHNISWIHMPVPKSRTDSAYFEPLRSLNAGNALVVLGLLHMDDEDGTKQRIEAARPYWPEFGIATECGLGRATKAELESIISIAQNIIK